MQQDLELQDTLHQPYLQSATADSPRWRKVPITIPFALVVVIALALSIFFGAWAVSADRGQLERTLALTYGPSSTSAGPDTVSPGTVGLSSSPGGTAADTWWGKGLLVVCPLH